MDLRTEPISVAGTHISPRIRALCLNLPSIPKIDPQQQQLVDGMSTLTVHTPENTVPPQDGDLCFWPWV